MLIVLQYFCILEGEGGGKDSKLMNVSGTKRKYF